MAVCLNTISRHTAMFFSNIMGIHTIKTALVIAAAMAAASAACARPVHDYRTGVPVDSIIMSDPCVIADTVTGTYYMTGTGGLLWESRDLRLWDGPRVVAMTDSTSWMGQNPEIWAAEIHKIGNRYYYFATFTNNGAECATTPDGDGIPRRASHVLVSDTPAGPFYPVGNCNYTPSDRPTLDGTFWRDTDGKPYMVFCGEWLYNDNGTMEYVELKEDLSGAAGEPRLMFRASDSPWSREIVKGKEQFNRVTDGPWLFRTGTGRLGMIWTSWRFNEYTTGVAYSESGTLAGPWTQETEPVMPADFGHGMIFTGLDGRTILSLHSHKDVNGRYIRRPTFWEVDLSGDRLRIGKRL